MEDLIADEDVVVTITRTGYAKRTKTDLYRAQKRGGKGVQGAALKQDDIVAHFFVCSTHDWILFFTNKGRVYRAKAYELPEANRNARGQHVANLLAFQPDEHDRPGHQISRTTRSRRTWCWPRRAGWSRRPSSPTSTRNRTGGIIAINLREDDELIGAVLCSADDDLLLVTPKASRSGSPPTTRRCARWAGPRPACSGCGSTTATSCCRMGVVRDGTFVLVATEGGYAKRTPIEEYPVQGRGGKGVLTARIDRRRGSWSAR